MQHLPVLEPATQFARFQQKSGITRSAVPALINGVGFVHQDTTRPDRLFDGRDQRPVEITKNDNGSIGQWWKNRLFPAFKIQPVNVDTQAKLICQRTNSRQARLVPVNQSHRCAAGRQIETVVACAAGYVQDGTCKEFPPEHSLVVHQQRGGPQFGCPGGGSAATPPAPVRPVHGLFWSRLARADHGFSIHDQVTLLVGAGGGQHHAIFSATIAFTVAFAVMVSPMRPGAINFSSCLT
jgi:hypothetical protein